MVLSLTLLVHHHLLDLPTDAEREEVKEKSVKMKLKNPQGETVVKQGVIVEVDENHKDTSLIIECRWEDDLTNNELADLIPIIRSPTALRQRRALVHLLKD